MHQTGSTRRKTCIDRRMQGHRHALPEVEQSIGAPKDGATPEEFHPDTPKPKSEPEAAAPAKG